MNKTIEHERPSPTPEETEMCPGWAEIYTALRVLEDFTIQVPGNQAQHHFPDFLCNDLEKLFEALYKTEKKATPELLIEMYDQITARIFVIAINFSMEINLTGNSANRNSSYFQQTAAKWRFVAKELGIDLPWKMWIEGPG